MGKTAQKGHEKKRYKTGVYGPDGVFYSTGPQGEVQLVKMIGRGRKGMYWSHKTKDLAWPKTKGDEIQEEVKK
jgi:hypothetical protein